VADPDLDVRDRIRIRSIQTFLVGSGSGRLGPDPDPGLNKWSILTFFGVCKSHKYLYCLFLNFLGHDYTYFRKKNFRRNLGEILLGSGSGSGTRRFRNSDPGPDQVKNRPDQAF
jgi:hypothetical protein